jgi:DNA-directed RNA polymerase specialized sigma24 family protein
VTGVGVRRFSRPEDVADFVANVFLKVLESAGSYDPRRGNAVAWLYGLAGNVAAGMRRQQQRLTDAEHRLAGRCWTPTTMSGSRSASTPSGPSRRRHLRPRPVARPDLPPPEVPCHL